MSFTETKRGEGSDPRIFQTFREDIERYVKKTIDIELDDDSDDMDLDQTKDITKLQKQIVQVKRTAHKVNINYAEVESKIGSMQVQMLDEHTSMGKDIKDLQTTTKECSKLGDRITTIEAQLKTILIRLASLESSKDDSDKYATPDDIATLHRKVDLLSVKLNLVCSSNSSGNSGSKSTSGRSSRK